MAVDWMTIAATFGAAIAGSWFGARATNKQTSINVKLDRDRWLKERSFEFVEIADEFVSYSFRKNTMEIHDRDRLSRKLLTLASIVVPNKSNDLAALVKEVRKFHVGLTYNTTFTQVDKFFSEIQEQVKKQINQQVNLDE
jgi:hypothetical protein